MCGSLLSKFNKTKNQIDPAAHLFSGRKFAGRSREDSACFEDRGFWKDGNGNAEGSSCDTLATSSCDSSEMSETDSCSQEDIEAAVRVLGRPVLPSGHNKSVRLPVIESYINEEKMLMESARQILGCQGYATYISSSSITVAKPISATNSASSGKAKTAVAFDIPSGSDKTLFPSARVPWRLRRRRKIVPELTLQAVREKMRAAEERKLKELERIRDCARSRAGTNRPHPAEAMSKATKEKIASKLVAAEIRRNEEIDKRREAGDRASRSRNRIAAAQAFAKKQEREASSARKMEKIEEKRAEHQQKSDKQNKLNEKHVTFEHKVRNLINTITVLIYLRVPDGDRREDRRLYVKTG